MGGVEAPIALEPLAAALGFSFLPGGRSANTMDWVRAGAPTYQQNVDYIQNYPVNDPSYIPRPPMIPGGTGLFSPSMLGGQWNATSRSGPDVPIPNNLAYYGDVPTTTPEQDNDIKEYLAQGATGPSPPTNPNPDRYRWRMDPDRPNHWIFELRVPLTSGWPGFTAPPSVPGTTAPLPPTTPAPIGPPNAPFGPPQPPPPAVPPPGQPPPATQPPPSRLPQFLGAGLGGLLGLLAGQSMPTIPGQPTPQVGPAGTYVPGNFDPNPLRAYTLSQIPGSGFTNPLAGMGLINPMTGQTLDQPWAIPQQFLPPGPAFSQTYARGPQQLRGQGGY